MSFKINTNLGNKILNNNHEDELLDVITDKTVKIKNDGSGNYIYKLNPRQKKSNKNLNTKIIFDEQENKWVLLSL
tara:strand:+ start:2909 stop:3133 length:225 start_codon:yes stop_codon:yes gene_type:complete